LRVLVLSIGFSIPLMFAPRARLKEQEITQDLL
jgi:hypothetical protein